MIASLYVTGTDTGIGKTFCSVALLRALAQDGSRVTGMKPVASGCVATVDGLRNEDALELLAASQPQPGYSAMNPYALREPTAPEIAAQIDGVVIDIEQLATAHGALLREFRHVVVEGVGGWLAPLSDRLMQADLVRRLQLPVLLVVGIRLGCINHALLSARAIAADGLALVGWIGNRVDPDMLYADATLDILRQRLPTPCIGVMPFKADEDAATRALDQAVSIIR